MGDVFASALDLAAAIRRREVSPVEAATVALDRIEALNPTLNSVSYIAEDEALATARLTQNRIMNEWDDPAEMPPFLGVPIPIKELEQVAGWVCPMGSIGHTGKPSNVDTLPVARLRDAGFTFVGLTASPEFGTVSVTESRLHGVTRNPWNTEHTPGGSSGGAAASVASGMVPLAEASDGGGSIRIPASCCGLVGLKASRLRVPNDVIVLEGAATSGVVTRSVADTAALLDVMGRPDPYAWYNAPAPPRPFLHEVGADPGRLRIAVTTTPVLAMPVAPACADAVRRAADLCAGLGHDVFEHEVAWPDPDALIGAFLSLWSSGTAGIRDIDWDRIEPLDAALRAQAKEMDCVTYVEAIMTLQLATRSFVPQWGRDFDVLLTPTMAVEPLRVGELWEGSDADPTVALTNAYPMAIFTSIFNVTGQPAISLPVHVADSGLPVGVQIIGAPWDEATLIRLASQLEPVAGWLDRRPTIHEVSRLD